MAMSTVERIDAFFDQLAKRGHVRLLDHVSGTVEFDIEGADRRWITINRGDLIVSHDSGRADRVLTCNSDTFIRIISGDQNLVAAAIRGSVRVAGELALGLRIQRFHDPFADREHAEGTALEKHQTFKPATVKEVQLWIRQ